MIIDSRTEGKFFFGTRVISEASSSPPYQEGNVEMLHKQFLKTLRFLSNHEKKFNKFQFTDTNLIETINYLETNGISHYGVVITGPTKELLSLKEEEWG